MWDTGYQKGNGLLIPTIALMKQNNISHNAAKISIKKFSENIHLTYVRKLAMLAGLYSYFRLVRLVI